MQAGGRGASFVAGVLAMGAVAVNPWTVGLLAADGRLDDSLLVVGLSGLDAGLLCLAAALWGRGRRWLMTIGGLLAGAGILCGATALARQWAIRGADRDLRAFHRPLASAVTAEQRGEVRLGGVTRAVDHRVGATDRRWDLSVPAGGVLDMAVGVDPVLRRVGDGTVTFAVSIEDRGESGEAGEPVQVERRLLRLDDGSPTAAGWLPVTADLARWSGRDVTVVCRASYSGSLEANVHPAVRGEDLAYCASPAVRPRSVERPNVILLSIDTLAASHLGFMGYERDTSPTLDRMAVEGAVFERCYSHAPWTTPSHWSLFTATYPHVHRGNRPAHVMASGWRGDLPTMAGLLRQAGYATVAFTGGATLSASFGFSTGFDLYYESDANKNDARDVVDRLAAWIRDNPERSFFAFLHTFQAHDPYEDPYFLERMESEPSSELERMEALYDGDIRRADAEIARLRRALDELGIADSTAWIVTSDHGEQFTESLARPRPQLRFQGHGHELYDEVLHVPLVFHNFERIPAGRLGAQVRSIDVLPTLLDSLDLPIPDGLAGQSLRPLILGEDTTDRPVVSEATTKGTERQSLRSGGYKLVRTLSWGQMAAKPSVGLFPTPAIELFDLREDPGETTDVSSSKPEVVAAMLEELEALTAVEADQVFEAPTGSDVSDDVRDQLRALGYLD